MLSAGQAGGMKGSHFFLIEIHVSVALVKSSATPAISQMK